MQAELESIRVGYEMLRLSPEEIAVDRALDITSVKAALLQCSSKYRRDVGHISEDDAEKKAKYDFTDDEMLMVKEEIVRLALYAEDENVRTKNCHYLRDDRKGRRELRQALGGNTFNILAFNQQMRGIRENVNRAKAQVLELQEVSGA